jgi:hypothetical protein
MRKVFFAAIVSIATVGGAYAEVVEIAKQGWWGVSGGQREDGAFVCAMVSPSPTVEGAKIVLEYTKGARNLVVRLLKPTWTIPMGKRVSVILQFGFNAPFSLNMTGGAVELRGEVYQYEHFMAGFQSAGRIDVTFPSGSEPLWQFSTAGAGIVEPQFRNCVAMQNPVKASPPTQPFR